MSKLTIHCNLCGDHAVTDDTPVSWFCKCGSTTAKIVAGGFTITGHASIAPKN